MTKAFPARHLKDEQANIVDRNLLGLERSRGFEDTAPHTASKASTPGCGPPRSPPETHDFLSAICGRSGRLTHGQPRDYKVDIREFPIFGGEEAIMSKSAGRIARLVLILAGALALGAQDLAVREIIRLKRLGFSDADVKTSIRPSSLL